MFITLDVSSVKRSSSGIPHRTYSLQFLCLCLSAALSCKKFLSKKFLTRLPQTDTFLSKKFLTRLPQTDTNTETEGCMYGEGLLIMSA
jgi:hypothetical protein